MIEGPVPRSLAGSLRACIRHYHFNTMDSGTSHSQHHVLGLNFRLGRLGINHQLHARHVYPTGTVLCDLIRHRRNTSLFSSHGPSCGQLAQLAQTRTHGGDTRLRCNEKLRSFSVYWISRSMWPMAAEVFALFSLRSGVHRVEW